MHELIRISLQNWYLVDQTDIELRGASAFIGPTGAGKSSLQDAIQTVLTGNQARRLRLNASASGLRGRTVRDYCLGNPGGGLPPRRDEAESIIVLVFQDQETKRCVSVGVALEARADQPKEETLSRFIAPDYEYTSAAFVTKDEEGTRLQSWPVIREGLKKACPAFREYNANAGKFVQDVLVSMRRSGNPPDPKQFLKSFANAIKFEPIHDPTEFVRNYILEEDTLDVGRVRAEIGFWRNLNEEVAKLEEKLKKVKANYRQFRSWAKAYIESLEAFWTAASAEVDRTFLIYRNSVRRHKEAKQQLGKLAGLKENHLQTINQTTDRLQAKRDIRTANSASVGLERIELEIDKNKERENTWLQKLARLRSLKDHLGALNIFDHIIPNHFDDALNAAESYMRLFAPEKDEAADSTFSWLEKNMFALDELTQRIADLEGLEDIFQAKKDELSLQRRSLLDEQKELKRQADKIEKGQSPLQPRTERLMEELIAQGYDVTPLCEVVRIRDERWQFAIEALLGNAREALIVPPEQARDAVSYMHTHRQKFYGCHLVNTCKASNVDISVAPDSLASMIETEDPYAQAFMVTRIGSVKMVESKQELESERRAITPDGLYTSGMTFQAYRDLDRFILGRDVQKRSLVTLQQKAHTLLNQAGAIEKDVQGLEKAIRTVSTVVETAQDQNLQASAIFQGLESCRLELKSLATHKAQAEKDINPELLREIQVLENEIAAYKEELKDVEQEIQTAIEDRGKHRATMENDRKSCRAAIRERRDYDKGFAQETPQQIFELGDIEGLTSPDMLRERYLSIKSRKLDQDIKAFLANMRNENRQKAEATKSEADKAQQRARDALSGYVHDYRISHPMSGDAPTVEGYRWIVAEHERLENNELLPYRQKAEEARETVVNAIKEDLLNKLYSKFEKAENQRKTLNRVLSTHRFTNQSYSFKKDINERFRAFYDLACDVAHDPQSAQTVLSFLDPDQTKQAQAKSLLNELIESENDATPLADYRQYFTFDIEMEDEAGNKTNLSSRAKTGSGGEGQAGFYVAIAASLASAYFPGGRGHVPQGMGLAVFDEAFNKLDIKNTQALLEFMKTLGLQVLLAAPEANRPTFSEVLDTIVTVNKWSDGEFVDVDIQSEYPGERARRELHSANPEHLGVDGFRERMEKEKEKYIPEAAE